MKEPIDIVNLSPGIAGETTHRAFLLTKVNSNLTAKELSGKSNPEKEKKQALAFKKLLVEVLGFCSQHSQDSLSVIYTPIPRVQCPLLTPVSTMHTQDAHAHLQARHPLKVLCKKKERLFLQKEQGNLWNKN